MSTDANPVPQYHPLTGEELAKLVGNAVYNKLLEDSRLNPGVTYKLFSLQFQYKLNLYWQNELGEEANSMELESRVRVDVDPNVAPDEVRKRFGLEVPR